MPIGTLKSRLQLTEEEAFALLELAMTSPQKLTKVSEEAIHKLADYCRQIEPEASHRLQKD